MKITAITLFIISALPVIIGSLFKVMQWSDLFYGQISGTFILALGMVLLLIYRFRKNSKVYQKKISILIGRRFNNLQFDKFSI